MPRFPHHLGELRRRTGLTQRDVAVLLGIETRSKVSRYERRQYLPSLRTALAYELILQKPLAELFKGIVALLRGDIARRSRQRLKEIELLPPSARNARRQRSLTELTSLL